MEVEQTKSEHVLDRADMAMISDGVYHGEGEREFIEKQVEELHSIGVTNIINRYGTDDIDRLDRLWWSVLNKMIDDYMMK